MWKLWRSRHTYTQLPADEPPLRAELFSIEQLIRHAKTLAGSHQIVDGRGSSQLLTRLSRNAEILKTFNRMTLEVNPNQRITPAAEWLYDNFGLIEEQIQLAKRHLPRKYSRELPCLVNGVSSNLPRVYDVILELVSHVDAQIEAGQLSAFISAYQTNHPLKLGELWAIPIMLRLCLIDNLQRITTRLLNAGKDRELADIWVERLQAMAETNPSLLVVVVAEMAKSDLPLSSAFVSEFCQHLSLHSPVLHLARTWLEQRLVEHGLTIEQMIQQESQNQAADQVSVSHSIVSLRFLSVMDWEEFVETMSPVEEILLSDPCDIYRKMDFSTRDRYRHAVEFFALNSRLSEVEVAGLAIAQAAEDARRNGCSGRRSHVGYYLVDEGRSLLGSEVRVRWPWRTVIERCIHRYPLAFYLGGIGVFTASATAGALWQLMLIGVSGVGLVLFMLCFALCVSQLAVSLINGLSALLVRPSWLARLETSAGIAPEDRTMVVIPTMLTSFESIDRLIEKLEIHYLANRDAHLHFAVLTDFCDASSEHRSEDHDLLQRIKNGIAGLTGKYESDRSDLFFLFHRPRRWNAEEDVWMGYERKRGKLMEFNTRLRGGCQSSFTEIIGDTAVLPLISYVITLDTDTQLPRDSARHLIGTMAHPLNRPLLDAHRKVITTGYSILQPRVEASLPGSRRSWFVRIFAGETGLDPYTREVSDVYQDVFHEGSFIGKGIYDVDAFLKVIKGRFPENTILSHDLLEACYARSGLVSDVMFYEEFPSRYNVDIDRRHRWMRGDWQLVQWLLSKVPAPDKQRAVNPLSMLSQWKIFDNLRRSLIPVAQMALILGTWFFNPPLAGFVCLLIIALIALPGIVALLINVFRRSAGLPLRIHLRKFARLCGQKSGQVVLALAFLPYHAYLSLDAVIRTLLRLVIRRRLLEWQTSSDSERSRATTLTGFFVSMWVVPTVALSSALYLAIRQPVQLMMTLPLLALWIIAPLIAWWISLPIKPEILDLTAKQVLFLRHTARKTWHYFETFVSAKDNWLPPDNFQEVPTPKIASRTSPTNMGLALLANLSAYDFGYLSAGDLIRRTQNTLSSMFRLERHSGHFYNWYDTQTLQPLLPLYISSVDSGNLSGHLLTLSAGLKELADVEMYDEKIFTGLRDTVEVLSELMRENTILPELQTQLSVNPDGLRDSFLLLQRVSAQTERLEENAQENDEARRGWISALKYQCRAQMEELLFYAPWLILAPPRRLRCRTEKDTFGSNGHHNSDLNAVLSEILRCADKAPSLSDYPLYVRTLKASIQEVLHKIEVESDQTNRETREYLTDFSDSLDEGAGHAHQRLMTLKELARQIDELAAADFTFLFDKGRNLFVTGFNLSEHRFDSGFYDLLASEARLCSYVAIALGQVPQDHWFAMSRLLVALQDMPTLVSWSGSMFEYLMPLLIMPRYENTLLDHTCIAAVKQQIAYGKLRGVAWGISESAYNRKDIHLNYQYRAFGVPGLGLKRGLAEDLVIAPYATALALLVSPRKACENLQRLTSEGRSGTYGFYEAVDYTPAHLPPGETSVTIRSFMTHHHAMSLLSLGNLLQGNLMARRFMACPLLKAAELLLQERVPQSAVSVFTEDTSAAAVRPLADPSVMRVFTNPSPPVPEVHLLSNGSYHVAISSAGGGYSRWHDLSVTRWREDSTCDNRGIFVYLRDLASGKFCSSTYQPVKSETKNYEAIFTQARAEFRQSFADLDIHTEVCVSPEDNVELRRITISNRTAAERFIELTSYAEVVLATQDADESHPSFSNLFVQTEFMPSTATLLCTRRARSVKERPPWLLHLMTAHTDKPGEVSCETDRVRFVGRGGSLASPAAMQNTDALSNTVGSVLDPVISLRRTAVIPSHDSVTVDLIVGIAETRESALAKAEKYQNPSMTERAFDLAWTHSQVTLHQLNATE
ncbi:MAG: glucoamylase family protein, partial [Kiritimatiellia bacterium]